MSDYTPKTEMVKTRYAIAHGGLSDDEEDALADALVQVTAERDAAYTAIREALAEAPKPGTWRDAVMSMAAILTRIPTEGRE